MRALTESDTNQGPERAGGEPPVGPPDREGVGAETIELAASGDESAWREITSKYSRRVYALLRSQGIARDDAEELTQGVMVTVVDKVMGGSYREQGQFEAWLFRIAMNRARDLGRKRARRGPELEVRDADATASGDARASREDLVAMRDAIETLPESDREIISLRHHAGLSFQQIAADLGTPIGTLLARHHRAMKKLQSMIAPRVSESGGRS